MRLPLESVPKVPNTCRRWPTEMSWALKLPLCRSSVTAVVVATVTAIDRANCSSSLSRSSVHAWLTVSTLPLRAITAPSTLSRPAPGTLVPANTSVAIKVSLFVSKVPVAAVSVPVPSAASAVRPALPVEAVPFRVKVVVSVVCTTTCPWSSSIASWKGRTLTVYELADVSTLRSFPRTRTGLLASGARLADSIG